MKAYSIYVRYIPQAVNIINMIWDHISLILNYLKKHFWNTQLKKSAPVHGATWCCLAGNIDRLDRHCRFGKIYSSYNDERAITKCT